MKQKFILLTTMEAKPIIIRIASIVSIKPGSQSGTKLSFDFARNQDMLPKTEHVTESFEEVKAMIGL